MMSEVEVKEQFYAGQWKICFMQDNNESPEDYMYKQKVWVDLVVEILQETGKISPEEFGDQEAREVVALDYMLAMVYIKGVDQTRYGVLVSELKNDYAKGQDEYPTDMATAFALVNLY